MKIGEALKLGYDTLKEVNIETYMLDSQLLLCKVLNRDKLFIITNRDLDITEEELNRFIELLGERSNKKPIKYILGQCEFMGLDLFIQEGVLIPRGDTEVLVEEAIKEIKRFNFTKAADLCCGSGAIGLSVASFCNDLEVKCFDISDTAIEVTERNIQNLKLLDKVTVVKSDLLKAAAERGEKFDIILSNPPYIRKEVIPTLMDDVKNYEPFIALCGGEDGLDFYKRIVLESKDVLNASGMIIFEIGYDQSKDVSEILEKAGFENISCIKDLAGLDRVVKANLKIS